MVGSYFSAKMLSVYSTDPADWAEELLRNMPLSIPTHNQWRFKKLMKKISNAKIILARFRTALNIPTYNINI